MKLVFGRPEINRTAMLIGAEYEYHLHDNGNNLSGAFLDALIDAIAENTFDYDLMDGETDSTEQKKIHLHLDDSCMIITSYDVKVIFPIAKSEFTDEFINSVIKFSMYYAAPCNYGAILETRSFECFVEFMEKHKEKALALEKKIYSKWDSDFTKVTDEEKMELEKADEELRNGDYLIHDEVWEEIVK